MRGRAHLHVKVRRPIPVPARLERLQAIAALLVRVKATAQMEALVVVLALFVGVPKVQHRASQRLSVYIEDLPGERERHPA